MSPTNNDDQPIERLAELEQDVSPDFLRSVRKKIYRRTAASQVVGFSWNLPRVILLEMISLLSGLLTGGGGRAKL
jgi:hypothetical protein